MKNNPFDIPGLSANPDNPLLASLNMMQQIWGNMAKGPMGLSPQANPVPTVEELNKRIEELQAVESWLRLNLSMLSSTIQGLEIQRSTLTTLQSMAKSGLGSMPDLANFMAQGSQADSQQTESDQAKPEAPEDPTNESLREAGQAWWDLLQNQFDTIASATAQTMQQAQHVAENMSANVTAPSADSTFKAAKKTTQAAKKSTAKKASKTADAAKAAKKVAKKAAKKTATSKAKKTS